MAIVNWLIYSPASDYLQFSARLENFNFENRISQSFAKFPALMNCFKLWDDDVKKFLLSLHLLSVISIEVEGIEMNGSLNVNNYISGSLYSVEICLVIVQDCVQYLYSLKRK